MKRLATAVLIAASLSSAQVSAQDLSVTITNLTHGMAFTPILVSAHDSTGNLYDVGVTASLGLQKMAEGGDLTDLKADLDTITATYTDSAAPLLAGSSVTVNLNADAATGNTKLSVVSMLLPTNDAFLGLDAIDIPVASGAYTYFLNAYNAGTEANDELIELMGNGGTPGTPGIPNAPFITNQGTGGSGGVSGL
ncbi:MAG: spondin domain-containing protein [Nitrospira sp.]